MSSIDLDVLAGYNRGLEKDRLRQGIGWIEFERTKELLLEFLPPSGRVADVGGGYGEYSFFLAERGFTVHLLDIAEKNIAIARRWAEEAPHPPASMAVCDAVRVPLPDISCDGVLLMGPLYHIVRREDRLRALREAHRLLRPGGVVFAGALSRYATLLWAATAYGRQNELLGEAAFFGMCAREIADGEHIPPEHSAYRGLGRSHFHSPQELKDELAEAGFTGMDLRGILNVGWLAPDLDACRDDPIRREAVLRAVRLTERENDLMGLSTHLLCIAHRP